jgi:hypothetical protein
MVRDFGPRFGNNASPQQTSNNADDEGPTPTVLGCGMDYYNRPAIRVGHFFDICCSINNGTNVLKSHRSFLGDATALYCTVSHHGGGGCCGCGFYSKFQSTYLY